MKKTTVWVSSLVICLTVVAVMTGAGFYLFAGENETPLTGSKVEAPSFEQSGDFNSSKEVASDNQMDGLDEESVSPDIETADTEVPVSTVTDSGNKEETAAVKVSEPAVSAAKLSAPVDYKAQSAAVTTESQPVETEQPAAAPSTTEIAATKTEDLSQITAVAPVTYSWGSANTNIFRIEVKVTNNGGDTSRNVTVAVPLLENSSPYQTTTLRSTNYDIVSSSGRVSNFSIGDLAPGETKTIIADFTVSVRPVSINSSNETVEKARIAYEQYAGSGNCRTLALGFISKAREMGITAREVVGFARPQRGTMTSGSLQGCRHSWAEFYVDGLGWVPVDLTFQYFGSFPHASHVVEGYGDQSIKVNYTGGSLSASWSNAIL